MRYDVICDSCDQKFMIECSLKYKPDTHDQLTAGIDNDTIKPQPGHRLKRGKPACKGLLVTDFSTQKPIRHNINWIPTDQLK